MTEFMQRHIGPRDRDIQHMLSCLGLNSLDELIEETIPNAIRAENELELPPALTEHAALQKLKEYADNNVIARSYLGMGYHNTKTPSVILRNLIENPGWYTSYTPYQAEISQGRLEALLIFQTMVQDLTGMPVSNSSLLDEATAAAEAMTMSHRLTKKKNRGKERTIVDATRARSKRKKRKKTEKLGFDHVRGCWKKDVRSYGRQRTQTL